MATFDPEKVVARLRRVMPEAVVDPTDQSRQKLNEFDDLSTRKQILPAETKSNHASADSRQGAAMALSIDLRSLATFGASQGLSGAGLFEN